MLLLNSYGRPYHKNGKTHIFKSQNRNTDFASREFLSLCKCYPKYALPYEGTIEQVTCWVCKAIYNGEMTR